MIENIEGLPTVVEPQSRPWMEPTRTAAERKALEAGATGPRSAPVKWNRSRTDRERSRNFVLSFGGVLTHRITMPIRAEDRWLYPIDWQQISETIRFGRAGARCEQCSRPHMMYVAHLGDGRWWDSSARCWRNNRSRRVAVKEPVLAAVRTTYVVLACAHLNHDPGDSTPANLRALCQRCHIIHDAAEHRWRRWWNAFRLRAVRDLFEDPRLARDRCA